MRVEDGRHYSGVERKRNTANTASGTGEGAGGVTVRRISSIVRDI